MTIPTLTIVHSLPDRIRLHFSVPPVNFDTIKRDLLQDKRIKRLEYSRVSHTCLIHYDHREIELLHVLKMLSISLADEYNRQPILVRPKYISRLTALTQISGLAIVLASASRIFQATSLTNAFLGWVAIGTTAAAVIEHAYTEVKQTGNFDPEAISIVFLVNSAGKGQLIRGALFTWLTSFSRHLLRFPYLEGLKMTVVEGVDPASKTKYRDVIASGSLSMASLEGRRDI